MQNKLFIILPLFLFSLLSTQAQYYSSGADPASIKWQQIDTERFKLIFPEEFASAGKELAHYLDSVAPQIEAGLDHKPRKIEILVHGRSTYSNGFVSWAPRRIELYPNPSQGNKSTDWLKHLALHEYRHVVQIDKLRQGFTKYASWLIGEQATGAALGAYLPLWFIEGDAVITETTLSKSGRGRLPEFTQPLRARLTEYGHDSYSKAYLGSYKEFVPDYYKMGYHLTSEVRRRYGNKIWSDVIENVGRNSWSLIPFRKELKKTGFRNPKKMYQAVFDSLATTWQSYDDTLNVSDYNVIASGKDDYTNLEYPEVTEEGEIFAQLSGPGQRTRIVKVGTGGKTETIAYTGYRKNEPITANKRWIAWAESKPHVRWPNADYSVVRLYNRSTGKTSTLKQRSRFFSPTLAPESQTMAVVETTGAYEFFITLIDVATGETLKRIPTPENAFPQHPSWSDSENELIMVLLDDSGKRIVSFNTESKDWVTLRTPAMDEPKYPEKRGDQLWFTASTPHSEEIFRTHLPSGNTDRVTTSRFGGTSPAPLSDTSAIIYADYTPHGYQLVSTTSSQTEQENTKPADLDSDAVKDLIRQEPEVAGQNSSAPYDVENYSKWNLLNLHSWAPAYFETDDTDFYPGLTLMSQNLLGTSVVRAGYNAARSETREKFNAGFTYRGWFPVIDLDVTWGDFHDDFNDVYAGRNAFFTLDQLGKGNQIKLESGLRLPLNLSTGKWNRRLEPSSKLSWQNISNQNYEQTFLALDPEGNLIETGETNVIEVPDLDYWAMEYSLYFHNKLRGTSRDVNTRWGQSVSVSYRHTPWGNYNSGNALALSSRLNLPGIGRHHAISVDNSWQTKQPGDEINSSMPHRSFQRFNDILTLPRGYDFIYNDDMYVFRGTYQMPVWSPDASIGGLAYIKRFRANIFFDAARTNYELEEQDTGRLANFSETFSSTGIELMTDLHPLRFVLPFSIGYRGGFRDGDNTFFHEAVFSTSFDSFLINEN